jgi:hypothetical protein
MYFSLHGEWLSGIEVNDLYNAAKVRKIGVAHFSRKSS